MSGATYAGFAAGFAFTGVSGATGLASLGSGSQATLGPFDNTVATLGGPAYEFADLFINLGTATTLGTTAPVNVQACAIFAENGTNYETSYASSGQLYPLWSVRQASFPTSGVSASVIIVPSIPLRSSLGEIVVLNNTGVAFPSTVTATLYGYYGQIG